MGVIEFWDILGGFQSLPLQALFARTRGRSDFARDDIVSLKCFSRGPWKSALPCLSRTVRQAVNIFMKTFCRWRLIFS